MKKAVNENLGRLIAAKNAEETAEILRAAGEDISAEEAEQLFREIKEHIPGSELSPDELEAVSGGADRDWAKDGCAATMEFKSHCGSNDYCYLVEVTYDHAPNAERCPTCGTNLYTGFFNDKICIVRCKNCGFEMTKEREGSFSSFGN